MRARPRQRSYLGTHAEQSSCKPGERIGKTTWLPSNKERGFHTMPFSA